MKMCEHPTTAVRVHERTLDMITALNEGVTPEVETVPTFFMLYCHGSDHEETEIIDEMTFNRTYGVMPGHVMVMEVRTID